MAGPSILSLATAEAPHVVAQEDVKHTVAELFRDASFDVGESLSVFDNAGVRRRTVALPLAAYTDELTVAARNRSYVEVAGRMLTEAAERALPTAARSRVTHVVTVSSTGIATPSLECHVVPALGLPADVRRVPVFGLGCAGGVAGISIARDLAASSDDALVLLLCVELTSLTFFRQDESLRNLIACALFGDGAAAMLIGAPSDDLPALATLGRDRSELFPDTRDLMGWDVREEGWQVVFSQRIPAFVRANVARLVAGVAERDELRHYILHPGGSKVLGAYRIGLELGDEDLAPATRALERHGNMSAASVFFVLDGALRDPGFEPGPGVLASFGPGFTAEVMTAELLRRP